MYKYMIRIYFNQFVNYGCVWVKKNYWEKLNYFKIIVYICDFLNL